MRVYELARNGTSFSYTLPGMAPGAKYKVRLHFAETYWTAAGVRRFNVSINGTQVLMVAWHEGSGGSWGTNALLNKRNNETMMAIAQGVKRAPRA